MTQENTQSSPSKSKGKAFFDRADQVADTGNLDFAIELYLEGILREPENIERGHLRLRAAAMIRKAQGKKGPGLLEQLKRKGGKDPLENLINAEYLWAKNPGSLPYMERVFKAAQNLNVPDVIKWIADILLESQRQGGKPSKRILVSLADGYAKIEEYASAIQACDIAREIDPGDSQLEDKSRELSAQYTIKKGRYDQEGDFTKGIKDLDKQKELIKKDFLVHDKDFMAEQIEKSRQEYLESPTVVGKINGVVDALLKTDDESYENEAIDILNKAFAEMNAYQFKARIGDIRIKQKNRRYNKLIAAGDKKAAAELARGLLEFELAEYGERAVNYPTDLAIKFELGRRLFVAGKYDDAISALQQAQRDPRRHVAALNYLGQAFAKKDWDREAAETFQRALDVEMPEERSKELRYNLGIVLEKMNEQKKAQEQFSIIAQVDFNFKDVRQRLERLTKLRKENQADQA